MDEPSFVKVQDRVTGPRAAGATEVGPLAGTWVNTDPAGRALAGVVLRDVGGALRVRPFAYGKAEPRDWGEVAADAAYAAAIDGRAGVAFTASHRIGATDVELQANCSKGLLIVASFATAGDGERRRGDSAREFFRRGAEADIARTARRAEAGAGFGPTAEVPAPPSAFLGAWTNTNAAATGLTRVVFAQSGGRTTLRAFGAGRPASFDWGETPVEPFPDGPASPEPARIRAAYDFGFMGVTLHGWVKQGVLVLAVFNRFRDASGRADYFDREFFHREPGDDPRGS